jgi:Na+/H+ antiporter NhaC
MKKVHKKGIVTEYLPWLLIAIIVLAIVIISIFFLKGKGVSLLDQIKNLFRGS